MRRFAASFMKVGTPEFIPVDIKVHDGADFLDIINAAEKYRRELCKKLDCQIILAILTDEKKKCLYFNAGGF